MRWGDMRGSDNVEDRESAGPARGIGGGFKLGGVGLIAVLAEPARCPDLTPGRRLALGTDSDRPDSVTLCAGGAR